MQSLQSHMDTWYIVAPPPPCTRMVRACGTLNMRSRIYVCGRLDPKSRIYVFGMLDDIQDPRPRSESSTQTADSAGQPLARHIRLAPGAWTRTSVALTAGRTRSMAPGLPWTRTSVALTAGRTRSMAPGLPWTPGAGRSPCCCTGTCRTCAPQG